MMHPRTISARAALVVLLALLPANASAESLKAWLNGDQLHFEAPDLHFLSAEAQQRLHDGATVTYLFHVSASSTRNGDATASISYHCVFSFDILEEKYKVYRLEPGYRSASHLSETAARELCIDSLTIPAAGFRPDAAFWITMEYLMEDPRPGIRDDSHSILDTLVDIFGQRSRKPQPVDTLRGGPYRVDQLRKSK